MLRSPTSVSRFATTDKTDRHIARLSHLVQRWTSGTSQVGVCDADVSAAGVGRFAEVRMDQLVSMEGTSDYVRREGA